MVELKEYYKSLPSSQDLQGLKVYCTRTERVGYINDEELSWGLPSRVWVTKEDGGDSGWSFFTTELMVIE